MTGGIVIAMGDLYAGLFGNDEEWSAEIEAAAAEASGDHAWRLPLHERYHRYNDSAFADLKNSSDYRQASPILAAAFLETFAGEGPWAHLDIAGTAYLERGRGDYYSRLGATGYGVRLLAELARRLSGVADGPRPLRPSTSSCGRPCARSPWSGSRPWPRSSTASTASPTSSWPSWPSWGSWASRSRRSYGGAGGDTLAYAIAIEELTRIDSSVAITVAAHTSLGTMPFLLFGSEEQKRGVAARPRLGPAAGGVRPHRARRRLGRGRDPDDARSWTAASGW